jgi:hypothetical protein
VFHVEHRKIEENLPGLKQVRVLVLGMEKSGDNAG